MKNLLILTTEKGTDTLIFQEKEMFLRLDTELALTNTADANAMLTLHFKYGVQGGIELGLPYYLYTLIGKGFSLGYQSQMLEIWERIQQQYKYFIQMWFLGEITENVFFTAKRINAYADEFLAIINQSENENGSKFSPQDAITEEFFLLIDKSK